MEILKNKRHAQASGYGGGWLGTREALGRQPQVHGLRRRAINSAYTNMGIFVITTIIITTKIIRLHFDDAITIKKGQMVDMLTDHLVFISSIKL